MKYLPDGVRLCCGCGYFFDIQKGNLVNIEYWDMPAELAIKVMTIRKKPYIFCHLRKCSTPKNPTQKDSQKSIE